MEPGVWVKSSYSGYNGNCVEVAWHKSSHSNGHSQCAEVAVMPAGAEGGGYVIGVRDSKDPDGAVLSFSPADWTGFLARVKAEGHR